MFDLEIQDCSVKTVIYNTPQKLDKGLRWMITCRNLEEGRQDEKEKKVRCDIQG